MGVRAHHKGKQKEDYSLSDWPPLADPAAINPAICPAICSAICPAICSAICTSIPERMCERQAHEKKERLKPWPTEQHVPAQENDNKYYYYYPVEPK